jgi:hypothetical protein
VSQTPLPHRTTTRDDRDRADPAPAPAPTPMPTSNCSSGGWRVHQDQTTTRGTRGTKQTNSTHPHDGDRWTMGTDQQTTMNDNNGDDNDNDNDRQSTHPHTDEQPLVGWMAGAPGPNDNEGDEADHQHPPPRR